MNKLLLVEDNVSLREQLKWALKPEFEVLEADTLASALQAQAHEARLVCLDMGLENRSDRGLEVIDALLAADRGAKIVVITSNHSDVLGREAVARGAFDYMHKPVDLDELKVVLARALRLLRLEALPEAAPDPGLPGEADYLMIGRSPAMASIFAQLRKLARADVTVLISGESGTGKELCARAVHYHSARRGRVFVPINCGSIPESLIESELFGYVKGAFTGAAGDKTGLIESADGGTLFLDEIGEMPAGLQVKLLRFLQDRHLQPLGETRSRRVDVRVIAATNRGDLGRGSGGGLRDDLYYRLSESEIRLPPLRERGEDVLHIAHHVLEINRVRFGQPRLRLSRRTEKRLLSHFWPGNVRELCNRLNRASILCAGQTIEPEDLGLEEAGPEQNPADTTFREARQAFERGFLIRALRRAGGNVSLAARAMGLSRPAVYDMMKKLGVAVEAETRLKETGGRGD